MVLVIMKNETIVSIMVSANTALTMFLIEIKPLAYSSAP